jgi:hypothetical protein
MRRPYWGFHDITADMTSEDATCPRCGARFHCGVNDSVPCACTTVQLDAPTLAALRERYSGCLCLTCLQAHPAKKEAGAVSDRPASED